MTATKLHPFVRDLESLRFENAFNPYADLCEVHDKPNAPKQRASLLSALIDRAQSSSIDAIWVGRDLGYRGGRRTGLALTDDVHISRHAARWGVAARRPTIGAAVSERTAAIIWGVLDRIETGVFLWNVFPLHPHEAGNPFTNRQHNASERKAGEELLAYLISLLRPKRVVAIGNDAAHAIERFNAAVPVACVRHPSYGGQNIFVRQLVELYELRDSAPRLL